MTRLTSSTPRFFRAAQELGGALDGLLALDELIEHDGRLGPRGQRRERSDLAGRQIHDGLVPSAGGIVEQDEEGLAGHGLASSKRG